MAIAYCKDGWCEANKGQMDSACHDLKKEAGSQIIVFPPNQPTCYCICSCLATDTPVTTPNGEVKIQDVQVNSTYVMAAGKDLKFHQVLVTQGSHSTPTITENTIYLQYTLAGQRREMICTMDHVFVLHNGTLVTADMIAPGDTLVDASGQPVQVQGVSWGAYNGVFYEIATSMEPPDANLTNHLIITGGVVSGDFAVQAFVRVDPQVKAQLATSDRPIVGSKEWRRRYGDGGIVVDDPSQPLDEAGRFTHASSRRVQVPAHASAFLPASQAAVLEESPDVPRRKYNDMYYHEMCEWILNFYRCVYPDVEYLLDWYSDEVNAHSWVTGGSKYVYLSGGLARIEGFDEQGLYLAVAHEIGHLYGTPIDPERGVTCEGEADYFGSKIVLRQTWYGVAYVDNTLLAIDQLKTLWSYIPPIPPPNEGGGEGGGEGEGGAQGKGAYPSNDCRLETFSAALAAMPIPECAACEPNS